MTFARVGLGFDSHPLVPGRLLRLGGVLVEHDRGLLGHTDGDVLAHALIDALLGAAGLGDIGEFFPPEDPGYKDADTMGLLRQAYASVVAGGLRLGNADATIYANAPRLGPYRDAIRASLSEALGTEPSRVNAKFKTTEGLDPLEGVAFIAAHVIVSLQPA